MAEEVVNRRVNIYIDETAGAVALERLTKKENELVAAIEKGKKAGKDLTKEMADLAATQGKIGQLKDVMDGKLLPSIRQAEAAVGKLNRELKNLPANSKAAGDKLNELKKAEATLELVRQKALGVNQALDSIKGGGLKGILDTAKGVFLGGGLLGVAEGALSGLKAFFSGAIDEALEAEEATARFKAQLDNLGRGDVFERLTQAADDFAKSVGYLDNDEIIGVFEKLIDYGKLTEAQIKQLTPVIIDFAAKQRIDLATATDVITKALEGNGKALKTYGIDIKDAKDQSEAFGIIMTQLKPKVEGAAQAFGETTAGQIKKTRQEVKNLQEDIGTQLLPAFKSLFKTISDGLGYIDRLFSTGAISTDRTQFGANIQARQDFLKKLEDDFEQQSKDRQARLIKGQQGLIKSLGAEVRAASGQRKLDLFRAFNEEKALFDKYIAIYNRNDGSTVGINSPGGDKPGKGSKPKKTKDDIAEARKAYEEFSARTVEATAPILAAFTKINEAYEKDIETIQDSLKKGIISPEQAEKDLKAIERVLNDQRDTLGKKFGLNAERLGTLAPELTVEQIFAKEGDTGAKDLGKKVMNEIYDGAEEFINSDTRAPIDRVLQDWGEQIVQWGAQVSDIFLTISDIRSNAEQAAFDKEVANNEKRKDSAKRLYDSKLISQKEYDRRIQQIEKQQDARDKELRKKQFERDKNAQTVQALMNAASAVVSTLAARPGSLDIISLGAFRAIQLGIVGATTIAQIAAIRSAKPPQFESGGFIPQGSRHAQGGISLVDNRSGARVGEVEGGEPILSRKTYAANKPLIDSLMAQSTGGMSLSVGRLNRSMQTVFENGGFIPRASDTSNSQMMSVLISLNEKLSRPFRGEIVYGEYEAKSERIGNIRSQSIVS